MAEVVQRADGTLDVRQFEDASLYPALSALATDQATQETRIRAAAEKWLAAVTALCGLFSLAGVATAKDATAGLSRQSEIAVGLCVVLALIAAGIAIVTGYVAAYGWPRSVDVGNEAKVRQWYEERQQIADRSAVLLRRAVALAVITVCLLTLVMMLLWFLPRSTENTSPSTLMTNVDAGVMAARHQVVLAN